MPKKRILHIDIEGGALWGIHAAKTIEGIEREAAMPITGIADIFSGVSSGTMISAFLNTPDENDPTKPAYSAADAVKGIARHGPSFFPPLSRFDFGYYFNRYASQIKNGMTGRSSLKTLFSDSVKKEIYQSYYKDYKLRDSVKSHIVKTHLLHSNDNGDADVGHPLSTFKQDFLDQFCTQKHPENFHDDISLLDAVMASTAAPTVYPAHKVGSKTLIDPGLQHSPSFSADEILPYIDPDVEYMFMFISTGCTRQPTDKNTYDHFGIIDMLRGDKGSVLLRTVSTYTKSMGLRSLRNRLGEDHVMNITKSLVPANDHEQKTFPSNDQLDASPENIEKMIEFGEKQFTENRDQILRAIDYATGADMPENWTDPDAVKKSRIFFQNPHKKSAGMTPAP